MYLHTHTHTDNPLFIYSPRRRVKITKNGYFQGVMRSGKINYTLKKDSCERTCSPFSSGIKKNLVAAVIFLQGNLLGTIGDISHIQNRILFVVGLNQIAGCLRWWKPFFSYSRRWFIPGHITLENAF